MLYAKSGAHRAHGRAVANPQAHGVDHVVEVLEAVLVGAERNAVQAGNTLPRS